MSRHEEPGWWDRNWKWVCGCGCGCLLVPILAAVIGGGAIFTTFKRIADHEAYRQAVVVATENPEVVERLGEPIEVGGLENFSVHGTRASMRTSLTGPAGEARLEAAGRLVDGEWVLDDVEVVFDDGVVLDVFDPE